MYSSPAQIAIVGKVAITGTAFLTTASSTTMIQYITRPYIISMDELVDGHDGGDIDDIESANDEDICRKKERKFVATTLSLLGNPLRFEFKLSDIERHKGIHPFATHMIKGKPVFLFSRNITDEELKARLS